MREIVILGGGTAGWMAAACMGRVLGTRIYSIKVIESPEIGTVGVGEATIPMIDSFHQILGLTPLDIVQHTDATFKLGIEFADWLRAGHRYFHPFGPLGTDLNGVSFIHYWLRHRGLGGEPDFGAYSLETQAARAGRFSFQPPPRPGIPRINHAYHFDASLYAALMRQVAESCGVERIEGTVQDVRRNGESGDVEALVLSDGRSVNGGFFIDCSGFRGLLIGQSLGVDYEDWTQWLPCDRALAVPSTKLSPPPPYTRSSARSAGWQWRIPLQSRTGNGYVFSSAFTSTDDAAQELLQNLDGDTLSEPRELRFTAGRRSRMWEHNVVALGLASGFMEPLESTSIHLVQTGLAKLMAMFPRGHLNPDVIRSYNIMMGTEYERIRDFLVAHYKLTEREDTEFWRHCKTMEIPSSLADRLDLFRKEAMFLEQPHDLFKEGSWFAVLVGQGLVPDRYHPIADTAPEDALEERMSLLRSAVETRARELPTHEAFLQSCMRSGPPIAATAVG